MILLSVSSDPALILFRKAANSGKTKQQLKSLLAEKKKERRHLPAHKTQVNLEQLYLTSLEKFCQYLPAEIPAKFQLSKKVLALNKLTYIHPNMVKLTPYKK